MLTPRPILGKGGIASVISFVDPIWDPIRGDPRFEKLRSQKGEGNKPSTQKKVTILCSTRCGTLLERKSDHRSNLKTESQIDMNTNQSNDSFPSIRVFCSKAKMRGLSLAFLLCLSGSAWAGSLPFDLIVPDVIGLFRGSPVDAPGSRPRRMPPIMPPIPAPNPGPTPFGPPSPSP